MSAFMRATEAMGEILFRVLQLCFSLSQGMCNKYTKSEVTPRWVRMNVLGTTPTCSGERKGRISERNSLPTDGDRGGQSHLPPLPRHDASEREGERG